MLTQQQLQKCEKMLTERKRHLADHLEDHYGTQYELIKESMGELSNYDNHPGDHGSELFEREKDIALNDHAEQEMKDINHALTAIQNGQYGVCEVCGKDIPFERLEAMPTTTRCLKHAEDDISNDRPAEEDVFHPSVNEMETEVEEEESTIFDAEDSWQRVAKYGSSESPSDFYDTEKDYEDMFFNSDELVSGTEEIENFLTADIDGKFSGVNPAHEKYEDYLDENEVNSILYD
ncbi:yteA family sporulation protein [Sediminibacillus dalangtanensis]|uniref:YteA family sporulation protein n=1 Tax=Sediminibacillus dalangtanensis TaxID=2729421 RepID=A0ABX7VUR7_9BACI|nr:TraR/DksA C4-type zinc finger protein [Sediminibacillus dalangtanensis]QTM98082.1 yteA family sporulation protein [Sediminibacillus dalangtanensis]